MSDMEPLNAGRLPRALTLLVVWIKTKQPFRLRSTSCVGLLSMLGFCIKVKPYADLTEAHAMQLVAQRTSIPVPRVYYALVHRGATYIVMSRICGQMAWLRWKERSEASRRQILDQLSAVISQLRSIPRPEGIGVAKVDGGPIYDCRFPTESFLGPFATVQDFHRKLINCTTLDAHFGSPYEDLDELLGFYRNLDDNPVSHPRGPRQFKYSSTRR
ncbi:hypothetical protein C8035_v001892 [Colletotrichum spinosum]|uniref:Aminoglycoside phosphotransferase domain-containing protein n=1 Tax=Colletotrichum spinosum TaxID=1347390 RepID=A0A4R8PYP8_9PEZI|nr:hypothetical protein C8035_v001892 [Colletotrichum spinosum]